MLVISEENQNVQIKDVTGGDVIRFDCKTLKGDERWLGIVGIEVENLYEALDFKSYKEKVYKLPLFQDLEEHIFYSPLNGYKAHKPFVVLGFTPLKKFS